MGNVVSALLSSTAREMSELEGYWPCLPKQQEPTAAVTHATAASRVGYVLDQAELLTVVCEG